MDVTYLMNADNQRSSFKRTASWISCFALLLGLGISGTASAIVTKDYLLTPSSKLITPIATAEDFLTGTGTIPTWLDGSLGAPPVDYGTDVPVETLNIMRVEFPDDGSGNIIDGTVTITLLDYYHDIDTSIPGVILITGRNDSTYSGAVGSMTGGVVTNWSTPLTGFAHNELKCVDDGAPICGTLGLPASGDTSIVHDHEASINIDTAGVPSGANPMTFSGDFSTVTLEITIDESSGRQYYEISGSALLPPVPLSNTSLQILMISLMALAGFYALHSGRVSPVAMWGK